MNRIFNFVVPALGGLLICIPTSAQMRGGRAFANPIPARPLPSTQVTTIVRPPGNSVAQPATDRKSTRLNSSHPSISYAVFCLKKKNTIYFHFYLLDTHYIIPLNVD